MTTPDRFLSGAVDLGQVKARAEARAQAAGQVPAAGTVAAFTTATMANFEAEVLQRSLQVPVVVLVGTPRSPDSEQLKADLKTLATEASLKFVVAYVDADATPEIAQMLRVSALPTVVALAAGRPLTDFQGGQPLGTLRQWTDSLVEAVGSQLQGLPEGTTAADGEASAPAEPPTDPRLDAATDALNAGDFDAAVAAYEQILAAEPKNEQARRARDNARLLARLSAQASAGKDPLSAAAADPDDLDKAFAAADAEIAANTPEAAFERLIGHLTRAEGEDKTRVRERLVELFALFEPSDPRVIAARGKMASVLY